MGKGEENSAMQQLEREREGNARETQGERPAACTGLAGSDARGEGEMARESAVRARVSVGGSTGVTGGDDRAREINRESKRERD